MAFRVRMQRKKAVPGSKLVPEDTCEAHRIFFYYYLFPLTSSISEIHCGAGL